MTVTRENIEPILRFRTSRSSGAGGQAVNKLETRVEVVCVIDQIDGITDQQKEKLRTRLKNRINSADELSIAVSDSRSQHQNKEKAIKRLVRLINSSLKDKPPRKPTKPTAAAEKKRLEEKSKRSAIKSNRRWKLD